MTLYINSCVRSSSRTDRLARAFLKRLGEEYIELFLPELDLQPLSEQALIKRTALIERGDYSDPMFRYAKQFAAAERIVIAAPFWDGSFPAVLKLYLENIYVTGIVSRYGSDGIPIGMCKANELIYVTTAGGPYTRDYSFNYIKALATNCFGIEAVRLIMAENLDVNPAEAGSILSEAIRNLTERSETETENLPSKE